MINKVYINNYRSDIDGLRAIAISLVIFSHAFPEIMKSGFIGIDIFFVISGFLITSILIKEFQQNSFSILKFYERRILRIFPACIITFILVLIVGYYSLLPDEYKNLGFATFASSTSWQNINLYLEQKGIDDYFAQSSYTKILLHLWSLGVEEQFYLIFPLILWLIFANNLRILLILSSIALVSFNYNLNIYQSQSLKDFYFPTTRRLAIISRLNLGLFDINRL